LSKTALSVSVGIAFSQRTWTTLKSKFLSLGSINDLFAATSNPLNFFNTELLWEAKVALLLALLIW
jgi:hypothetical protein